MTNPHSIPRKSLGRTGLQVSALGFGCAPLGDLYGALDEATAVDTIVAAVTHKEFAGLGDNLGKKLVKRDAFSDVKAAIDAQAVPAAGGGVWRR